MKRTLLLSALILASAQAFAAAPKKGSLHCYSNYYGANHSTIDIDADIADDDTVKNLKVVDNNDGFEAKLGSANFGDGNHKPNGPYAKYQDLEVNNQEKKPVLASIAILLPQKLTTVKKGVEFDGYASDPNADNSGSDGYQKLICHIN